MELLEDKGAALTYSDPYIPRLHKMRKHIDFSHMSSAPLTEDLLKKHDAVLITTDHTGIDYQWLVTNSTLVVDTRNATREVRQGREKDSSERRRGFTIFLTGLSGAGKSTTANVLVDILNELSDRPVTLLDGDVVRRHLSSELGFSKEHRDINIRRIGFVASEITKNGGACICAPIAPYDAVRKEVRAMIEPLGGFFLVHMATPMAVCESRDPKGLYAKARAGLLTHFTGVSDPYEIPEDAEITIDTSDTTPNAAADVVIRQLKPALCSHGLHGIRGRATRTPNSCSSEFGVEVAQPEFRVIRG